MGRPKYRWPSLSHPRVGLLRRSFTCMKRFNVKYKLRVRLRTGEQRKCNLRFAHLNPQRRLIRDLRTSMTRRLLQLDLLQLQVDRVPDEDKTTITRGLPFSLADLRRREVREGNGFTLEQLVEFESCSPARSSF